MLDSDRQGHDSFFMEISLSHRHMVVTLADDHTVANSYAALCRGPRQSHGTVPHPTNSILDSFLVKI